MEPSSGDVTQKIGQNKGRIGRRYTSYYNATVWSFRTYYKLTL